MASRACSRGPTRRRTAILAVAALAIACAFGGAVGCDKTADPVVTSRSEQVIATGPAPASAPTPSEAPHPSAPRTKKLCDGDGNAKGRTIPKMPAEHVEAPGVPRLDGLLTPARGAWTWVNFWAAWCGPCKEEMPRLVAWQDKLGKAGTPVRLVFVSLDDDRRQLEQFLGQQPADGVKASLWLPDGPARAGWLASLRMKSSPDLPEQALVDPSGRVRCFVEGAVDDGDYAEIASVVAR